MKLSDNKILITGGTSGIGLGLTERFNQENSTVIICGGRKAALEDVRDHFPSVVTKICNLSIQADRIELYIRISENTVPEQNEGRAIKFTVTKLTQVELNFSNPSHNFPTGIHYHLTSESTLHAFISGPNQSGKRDIIPFYFMRVVN